MKASAQVRYNQVKELIDAGKTNIEISEVTGMPVGRLIKYLSEKKLRTNRHKKITLSPIQYQLILGTLLGDGCIDTCGKNTPTSRLTMKHSLKQEGYVDYKISLLGELQKRKTVATRFTDFNNGYSGDYSSCSSCSINHPLFNKFREDFYVDGRKTLPDYITDLEGLGIAIWFMDDGSRAHKTVKFYTDNFNEVECEALQEVLKKKFGIETLLQRDVRYGSEKLRIYVRVRSYPKFKELVLSFMTESMLYKLP